MVRLEEVYKYFKTTQGRKIILDNVSLELPTDRNIGFIGKNGAGKSTLVRILAGSMAPNSGKVTRLVRMSWPLGFVGGFPNSSTAYDTIRFVSRIYGEDWRRILERVEEFAELGDYLDMPIATYSSGMRSRLVFGLSFAIDFECYLMDEILGVGDARFRQRADALMTERFKYSKMILVSHNPNQLIKYCKSGVVLQNGKLTYFEDVRDALKYYEQTNNVSLAATSEEI
ncbi:ABC transporter ATP-binding protein [Lacibacterium aquatile]|uniref:ABC transporter ATP-binding protein n=1 Tax=Lacibacterium aquatile TaxID=1168082 RepID=A0ABW5DVR5_9PROT